MKEGPMEPIMAAIRGGLTGSTEILAIAAKQTKEGLKPLTHLLLERVWRRLQEVVLKRVRSARKGYLDYKSSRMKMPNRPKMA